jgi:hypothetical protein
MTITIQKQQAKADSAAVSLVVEQDAMKLTVKAGAFIVEGEQFEFFEDQEFTATADADDGTYVRAYLAVNTGTGDPVLFVDEEVLDGNDAPFVFEKSDYRPLHILYHLTVPAAETSLDNADITVFHVEEPEVSTPPGPGGSRVAPPPQVQEQIRTRQLPVKG